MTRTHTDGRSIVRIYLCRAGTFAVVATLIAALTVFGGVPYAAPRQVSATSTGPALPLTNTGTWITGADGRVVVLHGMNQVYKVPPYTPSADGFGASDAEFLATYGFNAMRLGVIWKAVEPQPGVYDDTYLASIAQTVQILAANGIVSLLDFHQDLYNELFQGEGAPDWAVQTGGLPNPQLGFSLNNYLNPAENYAWGAFWRNVPASDGVGLQDHLGGSIAHTAAYFLNNPNVLGYEVWNEPWPGPIWLPCVNPITGCILFDSTRLTDFYNRVVPTIRAANPTAPVFFEPNTIFNVGIRTNLRSVNDPHTVFAFHDYCITPTQQPPLYQICIVEDEFVFNHAKNYANKHGIPQLMTEFGATEELKVIAEVMCHADDHKIGWLYWAYTGNDKTSVSPNGQAVVINPALPKTGDNVNWAKLKTLATPYPQVVAGTPTSWSFTSGILRLSYSTERADGQGRFAPGTQTVISVPQIWYPNGYRVTVTGGQVASAPGAPQLIVLANQNASTVNVVVQTT
ncbi:cellulase family glycosylhydrolase [Mycobacterium riyadhense]|uniref:cellulase family glycosylhydrolase n=1 Tax=Mycobacterium riyadhense TaxID=486698 RepID=UPI00111C3437|nr:cellulase family glycosylhydrolase [Mycobacterium riyadhense]